MLESGVLRDRDAIVNWFRLGLALCEGPRLTEPTTGMPIAMPEKAGLDAGAPGTVEELFTALEAPLLRYAHELVRNMELAEDIVQEAFMRVHAEFGRVQHPRLRSTWNHNGCWVRPSSGCCG